MTRPALASRIAILLTLSLPLITHADALDDELAAAKALLLVGKAEEAGPKLEALEAKAKLAVAADPAEAHGQFILGMAAMYLGNDETATLALNRAARLDPKSLQFALGRAQLATMQDKPADAVTLYKMAIVLDPKSLEAWSELAAAQMDLGRFADAQASFEKCLALDAANPKYPSLLAQSLISQHKDDDALAAFQKSLALDPKYSPALAGTGKIYQDKMDFPKSLDAYTRAAAAAPDDFRVWAKVVQLNETLGKSGDRDAARAKILALFHAGKVDASSFCRQTFPAGTATAMAFEYFEPAEPALVRYAFNIVGPDGKTVEKRISLGGKTDKGFTLDAYTRTTHELLAKFPAEPTYEQTRDAARQYLDGKLKPLSSEPVKIPESGAAK